MALNAPDSYNQVERGAERELNALGHRGVNMIQQAANNVDHFTKQEVEKLESDIKELTDAEARSPELDRISDRLQRGEVIDLNEVRRAREVAKQVGLGEAKKRLQETVDSDEDDVMGFTKGCLKFMNKLDAKGIAGQLKEMEGNKADQLKLKRRVTKLKGQSPRAFKLFLKKTKIEKEKGTMQQSREQILDDIEKTYKDAMKAPSAIQGEFFKQVEGGAVNKKDFKDILKALDVEYNGKLNKYLSQIDDKLFGKEPAEEFRSWIAERKDFAELDYAQSVLENKYLPERRDVQKQFEDMPEAVTREHQEKWNKKLGHSERKALVDTLQKLEHQQDNPFAKEHIKNLTDNQKEFAPKEWAKLTQEFLQHSYEEQEALNKVFKITELKQRQELTKRFEDLPEETQNSNKEFFASDKNEKIILLDALEKTVQDEDATSEWSKVLDTEQGQKVYRDKLKQVMSTNEGEALDVAGILAKQAKQYQQMTGSISAQDRHENKIRTEAGDDAADKVAMLHEMSDGQTTVDEQGRKKEIHSIDMLDLKQGRLERDEITTIKDELNREGFTDKTEDAYTRVDFTMGQGKSLDLAKNTEQTKYLEDMVQAKLVEALMMTIEAMSGRPMTSPEAMQPSDEEMRKMLTIHQDMTKQKFKGVTSIVHEKMAS